MSLLDVLRSGVAITDSITKSWQATVYHKAWIGADSYGKPMYAPPVERVAIVDKSAREHRTGSGEVVAVQAYVTFLDPIPPNGAAGRLEPIDANDLIILPDGTTGPIVDMAGFVDAGTNAPLLSEVWIGKSSGRTA